jgi:non-reducing end alpha-L-arabinofuranosidase
MTSGRWFVLVGAGLVLTGVGCWSSGPRTSAADSGGAVWGSGGSFVLGGSSANGAAQGSGGAGGAVTGGGLSTGGGGSYGGASPSGGDRGSGGVHASGGASATGGTTSSGIAAATGGATGAGGARASGGSGAGGASAGSGGTSATGGSGAGGTSNGSSGASAGGGVGSGGRSGAGGSSATGGATSAATGPCDIYAAGNAPCTAAFSSVRALYGTFATSLYQVKKADGSTKDIGVVAPGGIADATAQDAFCAGATCTISVIYDQSGNGNHLKSAPKGGKYGPYDCIEAVADALPVKIGGKKAYGIHVAPSGTNYMNPYQTAYRNNQTKGTATGDTPESIYMVADGTYYNNQCCFDFGNAETSGIQAGPKGSMHAIYLGNCTFWNKGAGSGPWIMADLESGLFNTTGAVGATNSKGLSMPYAFVTAMTKNNSVGKTPGPFTLRGANAQSGTLITFWDGARPTGYEVMQKQGAIVLGIGGDTGSGASGKFFEGAMTNGYAPAATEDAVQANIVAAGYSK